MHTFLYGPPLTGKSTLGRSLALRLQVPFLDLDQEIVNAANRSIPEIFQDEGEAGFRLRELALLRELVDRSPRVIALGGGTLLNPVARELVEKNGQVLCLDAPLKILVQRHYRDSTERPLLSGDLASRLEKLLAVRKGHYDSFPLRLNTEQGSIDDLVWQAQSALGSFRICGMGQGYDVRIAKSGLYAIGHLCRESDLKGPIAVISDEHVGRLYGESIIETLRDAGYGASLLNVPPGEEHKSIHTILKIWDFLLNSGVERGSTVIALGGGVVGDMTGFAAATFLRGVTWVNLPTSLLAMVDSSLGGKTGIDLPQAKNLVGAFYPPRLVLADPDLLGTLPERELRSGLAEVMKHGIIGDPELYSLCKSGIEKIRENLNEVVRRGMLVKMKVIEADPYEKGLRQALNLGHTVGHGIEMASGFSLSHGEAIAIGMVVEASVAEEIGLAQAGLCRDIVCVLETLGLPTHVPEEMDVDQVIQVMQLDKKRAGRQIHFALPVRVGEVKTGVLVEDWSRRVRQAMRSES